MEHPIARRRMNMILDHVARSDEIPTPNPHLFPMNCSSTLNSMVRRCDSRLLFARQGSASQACFMQQVSIKQSLPLNASGSENRESSYQCSGGPMFSRQAQMDSTLPASKDEQFMKPNFTISSNDAPKFARQNSGKSEKNHLPCSRTGQLSSCKGMEWSPRVDVGESGSNYIVLVELPGVSIMDIRVEVDDQNLIVTGRRITQEWRSTNGSENLNLKYHQREILQGPYRVILPLPNDVNKDGVAAEFVNGFLRITLPKH